MTASFSIRTIYFKSSDISGLCRFWSSLLKVQPHKDSSDWKEINCGNMRLGFLNLDEKNSGSNCVPVFELQDIELNAYVERALAMGAKLLIDGRNDPKMLSALMQDPFGNEFELSKFH